MGLIAVNDPGKPGDETLLQASRTGKRDEIGTEKTEIIKLGKKEIIDCYQTHRPSRSNCLRPLPKRLSTFVDTAELSCVLAAYRHYHPFRFGRTSIGKNSVGIIKMNPSDEAPLTEEQCLVDSVTSMVDHLLTQLQSTTYFYSPGGPLFRTVRMELLDLKRQYSRNIIALQEYAARAAKCAGQLSWELRYDWAITAYTIPQHNPPPYPPMYEGVEVSQYDFSQVHMQLRRTDGWNEYESTHRRGQFNIVNVEAFRCSRCITNVHSVGTCTARDPRCAHCWQYGHRISTCPFHLCVHCLRYGHGRRQCPENHLPARCNNCFINTREHVGRHCPNPRQIYCRHCGLDHNHKVCPEVSPQRRALCYKHNGAHNFSDCPNPSNG